MAIADHLLLPHPPQAPRTPLPPMPRTGEQPTRHRRRHRPTDHQQPCHRPTSHAMPEPGRRHQPEKDRLRRAPQRHPFLHERSRSRIAHAAAHHSGTVVSPAGPRQSDNHQLRPRNPAPLFFTDLCLVTELITTTWPAARRFAPTHALAEIIDRHIDQRDQHIQAIRSTTPPGRGLSSISYRPPLAAEESGALLTTATQLLTTTTATEATTVLDELLQQDTSIWQRRFLLAEDSCSPGLLDTITTYAQTHPNPPQGRRPHPR